MHYSPNNETTVTYHIASQIKGSFKSKAYLLQKHYPKQRFDIYFFNNTNHFQSKSQII